VVAGTPLAAAVHISAAVARVTSALVRQYPIHLYRVHQCLVRQRSQARAAQVRAAIIR
jgi:hypothetical protein